MLVSKALARRLDLPRCPRGRLGHSWLGPNGLEIRQLLLNLAGVHLHHLLFLQYLRMDRLVLALALVLFLGSLVVALVGVSELAQRHSARTLCLLESCMKRQDPISYASVQELRFRAVLLCRSRSMTSLS